MKIKQRRIKTTKYYSKKLTSKDNIKSLINDLEDYADNIKIFDNMTKTWFIIKGNYYPDAGYYPEESITDFTDITSKYNLQELTSKPKPEKKWNGSWIDWKQLKDNHNL